MKKLKFLLKYIFCYQKEAMEEQIERDNQMQRFNEDDLEQGQVSDDECESVNENSFCGKRNVKGQEI